MDKKENYSLANAEQAIRNALLKSIQAMLLNGAASMNLRGMHMNVHCFPATV